MASKQNDIKDERNGRVGGEWRNLSEKREREDTVIICNAFNTKKLPNHETLRDTPSCVPQ